MTRTRALVGAILVGILAAGCLIKGPEPVPDYFSNIRIYPSSNSRPPYGLEPAPAGYIYQLWLFDFELGTDSTIHMTKTIPLTRFQWNSEYFFAISDSGETLGLTSSKGMDIGANVLEHDGMALSVEPKNDIHPDSIDGPIIMGNFVSAFTPGNQEMDLVMPIAQMSTADAEYSVVAPSFMKHLPGRCWRDSAEGMGIWFAKPSVADEEVNDTVALCMADVCPPGAQRTTCWLNSCGPDTGQARGTHFGMKFVQGKKNLRGPGYNLWIFPSELSKSFCNFDTVFANQEPDLRFRDSVPEHLGGNVGPQMPLGEDPIIRNGATVGYMYFRSDTTGLIDTCFLRIDIPESTHCTSDSFQYAPFNDTTVIVRTFLTTWADTTYTSSLPSLAEPQPYVFTGTKIFKLGLPFMRDILNLEYEAWVVIDNSDGPIKPISLGKFIDKNALDSDNSHFTASDLPAGFHFPGEDFLQAINRPGIPSSNLDLLSLVNEHRVKIWITLEPIRNDWAPTEPNRQLIMYSGELAPDTALATFQENCQRHGANGTAAPPVYSRTLTFREVSASSSALNEGHNWPTMKILLRRPQK